MNRGDVVGVYMLARAIERRARLVLCLRMRSWKHVRSVFCKFFPRLVADLKLYEKEGRIRFVSTLDACHDRASSDSFIYIDSLYFCLEEATESDFYRSLQRLVRKSTCIMILSQDDIPVGVDWDLSAVLDHASSHSISLRPLSSGYSKQVHGTLRSTVTTLRHYTLKDTAIDIRLPGLGLPE